MWKETLLLICLTGYCCAGPVSYKQKNMPIMQREKEPSIVELAASDEMEAEKPSAAAVAPVAPAAASGPVMMSTLTLPSNATSIRADITDGFSCANKSYGYYADVENDCQIFHVCLPVTYADGKENTFRWSFICPEDTVFSQDSFTCMRREDMSIDCEDSFKYYDLNSNFGMIDDDTTSTTNGGSSSSSTTNNINNKNPNHNTNAATSTVNNEDQEPAMSSLVEQHTKPALAEPVPEMDAVIPAVKTHFIRHKERPLNINQPIRRKPHPLGAHIHRRPPIAAVESAVPLRKIPQEPAMNSVTPEAASVKPEATAVNGNENEKIPEKEKPLTQKLSKRPSTTTASESSKDKIQMAAPSPPVRVEILSQKRKRPAGLNKKTNATTKKPIENVTPMAVAEAKPEIDTKLMTKVEAPAEVTAAPSEPAQLPADVKDSQPEASEAIEIVVPAEESPEEAADQPPSKGDAIASPAEEQMNLKPQDVGPHPAPLEGFEEIPAVIAEIEETNSMAGEDVPAGNSEDKVPEEQKNPAEEADKNAKETAPIVTATVTGTDADAAIVDSPAEEVSTSSSIMPSFEPSLEDLEEAKPVDAIEIMAASPQMEQHSPMVHEMFDKVDDFKQSLGDFKPVSPVMAAEAEALIADFLNALKKSENAASNGPAPEATETEAVEGEEEAQVEEEGNKVQPDEMDSEPESDNKLEETNKTENESTQTDQNKETEKEKEKAEETAEIAISSDVEQEEKEKPLAAMTPDQEPQNTLPLANMFMMNHFPADMYQIPVKVIEAPMEEVPPASEATAPEATAAEIPKEEVKDQPAENTEEVDVPFKLPLSIDDVVELVKEQLDQVPATTGAAAAAEAAPAAEPAEPTKDEQPMQPAENVIMPIFHRISLPTNANLIKAGNVMVREPEVVVQEIANAPAPEPKPESASISPEKSTQTADMETAESRPVSETAAKPATDETMANELMAKSNRSYRSRSIDAAKMDPRKRRFLFRSDGSR